MGDRVRRVLVAAVTAVAGTLAASTVGVIETPAGGPTASVAAEAAAPVLLPPLPGWKPALGPIFNEPGRKRSRAILNRVLRAINHTPRGETIRITTYSLDRGEIIGALRRARGRGVRVQVIVNKHTSSGLVFSLQRRLGHNPRKGSFVVTCPGRCRAPGDGGNQHAKVFSFTRTGGTRALIIGSSGNLTSKAVYRQWNDSWAIAYDPKIFATWVGFFNQMKFQKQRGARVVANVQAGVQHPYSVWLQRTSASAAQLPAARAASQDNVVRRLRSVGCKTRQGYGTPDGRTIVRIMEYAVYGQRGVTIAKEIAKLKHAGCDVMVIGSVFSKQVKGIIQRAGIPLRMADWSFAQRDPAMEDGIGGWGPRFYAHYKEMAVDGSFEREPTKSVWTGSENWSGISFANEEIIVRFTDPGYYRAYNKQFNKLWRGRATHRASLEPTYGPR
jgi:phosphatidylserine/phosphatidylglycerophosphate/cardiolipin synthase-like enzyme